MSEEKPEVPASVPQETAISPKAFEAYRASLKAWIYFITSLFFLGSIFSVIPVFLFFIAAAISATTVLPTLFFRQEEMQQRRTRYMLPIFFTGMQVLIALYAFLPPSTPFLFAILILTAVSTLLVGLLSPADPQKPNQRGAIFAASMLVPIAIASFLFRSPAIVESITAILEISTPLAGSLKVGLFFLCAALSVFHVLEGKMGKKTGTYLAILLAVIGFLSTAAFFPVPGLNVLFSSLALYQKIVLLAIPSLLSGLALFEKIVPRLRSRSDANKKENWKNLGFGDIDTDKISLLDSGSPHTLEEILEIVGTTVLKKCTILANDFNDFDALDQAVKDVGHLRMGNRSGDYLSLKEYMKQPNNAWIDSRPLADLAEEAKYNLTQTQKYAFHGFVFGCLYATAGEITKICAPIYDKSDMHKQTNPSECVRLASLALLLGKELGTTSTENIISKVIESLPLGATIFKGDTCHFTEAFETAIQNTLNKQRAYFSYRKLSSSKEKEKKGEKYAAESFGLMRGTLVLLALSLIPCIFGTLYFFFVAAGASLILLPMSYSHYKSSEKCFSENADLAAGNGVKEIAQRTPSSSSISRTLEVLGGLAPHSVGTELEPKPEEKVTLNTPAERPPKKLKTKQIEEMESPQSPPPPSQIPCALL
jgi:hypothetical protein